MLMNQVIAWRA